MTATLIDNSVKGECNICIGTCGSLQYNFISVSVGRSLCDSQTIFTALYTWLYNYMPMHRLLHHCNCATLCRQIDGGGVGYSNFGLTGEKGKDKTFSLFQYLSECMCGRQCKSVCMNIAWAIYVCTIHSRFDDISWFFCATSRLWLRPLPLRQLLPMAYTDKTTVLHIVLQY